MMRANGVKADCEKVRALIPAYSVGATDPTETRLVQAALVECPELQQELSEFLALSQMIGHLVPEKDELSDSQAMALFAGIELGDPTIVPPEPVPAPPANIQPLPQRRNWTWQVALAAAVISVVFLAITNLYWALQADQLRRDQNELIRMLSVPQPTEVGVLVTDSEHVHHRNLLATDAGPTTAIARIVWSSETEIGSLFAEGLPALPTDQVYQLWLVRDGQEISLGHFDIDESGVGTLVFQSPEPITAFDAIGISPEPVQGSDTPTAPHVVIGQI
jgi:uncharacterized membrane protein YwzB